jgi:hypothetical protein
MAFVRAACGYRFTAMHAYVRAIRQVRVCMYNCIYDDALSMM